MRNHLVRVNVRQRLGRGTMIVDVYPNCNLLDDYVGQIFSLGKHGSPGFVPVDKMTNFAREEMPPCLRRELEVQLETTAANWRAGEAYDVSIPDGQVARLASAELEIATSNGQMTLPGLSPRVESINAARKRRRPA